jgi:hypothetical protein
MCTVRQQAPELRIQTINHKEPTLGVASSNLNGILDDGCNVTLDLVEHLPKEELEQIEGAVGPQHASNYHHAGQLLVP